MNMLAEFIEDLKFHRGQLDLAASDADFKGYPEAGNHYRSRSEECEVIIGMAEKKIDGTLEEMAAVEEERVA